MAALPDVALSSQPPVTWPPDDTEESVLGTDLHQLTITNLRLGVNELAALQTPPGGPIPWQASGQIIFNGFQRPDGSRYQVLPDVFVCRRAFDIRRKSLSITLNGPPLLIIEILSDATYESDLDMQAGKGFSYAQAGVREYLTLDPTGEYLPEQGLGWRLEGSAYRIWPPEPTGRWQSREIPLAIGLEGLMIAVHTLDGRRLLREGEIERGLAAKDRQRLEELAQRDRQHAEELARQAAEIASLRRRLEDLEQGR